MKQVSRVLLSLVLAVFVSSSLTGVSGLRSEEVIARNLGTIVLGK
jgi:hypothetical protein